MKLDLRPMLAGEKLLAFDYDMTLDTSEENPQSVLYGVSFLSPMTVKGDITNTAGYMLMRLSLSVEYKTACARCLDDVIGSFTLDLEKTVATRDSLGDLAEDKIDDYLIVEDGFLDMDEMILDQLEINFPSRFLCRDDCLGLCQRCGKNLNTGKCDCTEKEIDPRLAPLAEILRKMKENGDN